MRGYMEGIGGIWNPEGFGGIWDSLGIWEYIGFLGDG